MTLSTKFARVASSRVLAFAGELDPLRARSVIGADGMIVEGDFESSPESRDLEKRQTIRQRKRMFLMAKNGENFLISVFLTQVSRFSVGHLAQMEM